MKIETAGKSKFLQQKDVLTPFVATIQDVRLERLTDPRNLTEDVYVVYFTVGKPLKLSAKINRKIVVGAYGDQSEGWIGKQIEIYHDPNVPNPSNPDRPGGIRVRIPAAPVAISPATNGRGPAADSIAKTPPAPAPEPTLEQQHARTLAAFAAVSTNTKLDEWARWANQFGFNEAQQGQLGDAYRAAKERIATAGHRRPTRVTA